MRRIFDEADEDHDGMLNSEEYKTYRERSCTAWRQKYGGNGCHELCAPLPVEQEMAIYESINKMNPDYNGIKKEDLGRTNMMCSGMNLKPGIQYRIWYFGFYGRAEAMRLLMTQGGCGWVDAVLTNE